MNRLIPELERLYFHPDQHACSHAPGDGGELALTPEIVAASLKGEATVMLDLASPDGRLRTLAIGFGQGGDWEQVAGLYQAVQEDLGLPAPAISISGEAGFQVWFSLAEAVPLEQAQSFLDGLRRRYLAELAPAQLRFHPDQEAAGGRQLLELVPALHAGTGKWSAFIDPSLGSMFVDEPGLEMAPGLNRQADLLAQFESIGADDFRKALARLQSSVQPAESAPETPADVPAEAAAPAGAAAARLDVAGHFGDPKSFLLAVMNDPSASAGLRIEAAKALLPYFHKPL